MNCEKDLIKINIPTLYPILVKLQRPLSLFAPHLGLTIMSFLLFSFLLTTHSFLLATSSSEHHKDNSVNIRLEQELKFDHRSLKERLWNQTKKNVFRDLSQLTGCSSHKKGKKIMEFVRTLEPSICVEIGSFRGAVTYPIASALRYLQKGTVYAIDSWDEDVALEGLEDQKIREVWKNYNMEKIYHDFLDLLSQKQLSRCQPIRRRSQDAVSLFADGTIDLLFIDGSFSETTTLSDVVFYLPKVREGGYIWLNLPLTKRLANHYLMNHCRLIKEESLGVECILFQKATSPSSVPSLKECSFVVGAKEDYSLLNSQSMTTSEQDVVVESSPSCVIVFVYIGQELPPYIDDALSQARLFNEDIPIVLIANHEALINKKGEVFDNQLIPIEIENLTPTHEHQIYNQISMCDNNVWDDSSRFAIERFFYLDELMSQYGFKNVIYLENNNLLYVNVKNLLPVFQKKYQGIGVIFDHHIRFIPSIVYFANRAACHNLVQHFTQVAESEKCNVKTRSKIDLEELFFKFKSSNHSDTIDLLPITTDEYILDHLRKENIAPFSNHLDLFQSIFDGGVIGNYLDRNNASDNGSVCSPSLLTYKWELDRKDRKVPYIIYKGKCYRVNNLHIGSKNLKKIRAQKENYGVSFKGVVYDLKDDPIDVVIPCHPKDIVSLELCIAGIKNHGHNIRRIIVVSKSRMTENAEWFSEDIFPFTKQDIATLVFRHNKEEGIAYFLSDKNQVNAMYQQLLKLYSPFVIPGISSNVLILDADTIFLKATKFLNEQNGAYFTKSIGYLQHYFTHGEKLIPGFFKVASCSGIAHHMLFQKAILKDFFSRIEKAHQMPAWKAICTCVDLRDVYRCTFSEYELYFNFSLAQTYQVEVRELKWDNISQIEEIKSPRFHDFNYVSWHSYLRTCSKSL